MNSKRSLQKGFLKWKQKKKWICHHFINKKFASFFFSSVKWFRWNIAFLWLEQKPGRTTIKVCCRSLSHFYATERFIYKLTWLNLLMARAHIQHWPAVSKIMLASKVVKTDSKLIIPWHNSVYTWTTNGTSRWFWWTLPLIQKHNLSSLESENVDILDKLSSCKKLSKKR
jgi:hypothetical protein